MKKGTKKIIDIISIVIFFVTIYFTTIYYSLLSHNNILENNNEIFKHFKVKDSNIFTMNNLLCIDNVCKPTFQILKVYFNDVDYKIAVIDNDKIIYMRSYEDKFSYEEIKNDIKKLFITQSKKQMETVKYMLLITCIVIIIGIIFIGG